jgi:quinol monooxygenase YgiN
MTHCTIIGMVVAKNETREELRAILTAQVKPTRAEEGCINYDFHVDAEDPNTFMFYENWRSRADLDAHLKTPHLQPLFGRLEELLARPVEIKFYEMLSDMRRD